MNPYAIALIILSTFMHASWNLLAYQKTSKAFFFRRMLIVIALIGLVPGVLSEISAHSLTATAWLCVVGSGFFCGIYFFYLALAYESSDFTVVYPVARALPVFLVAIGDVLRGRYPTALGWVGMMLVISGCLLAPLYSFKDYSFRLYFRHATLWMLLAALGTVGYTLLDKIASEVVQQGPATAARYGYVFFLIAFITYSILLKVKKFEQKDEKLSDWVLPFIAACLMFGAYWMVLWAYQLSRFAGYVVAFRQFSIIIGIILGIIIFKERGKVVRFTAGLSITTGLILIGVFGH